MIEKLGITPGPWEAKKQWISHKVAENCSIVIADVNNSHGSFSDETKINNALLIAAAPEMLEALIKMELILEDEPGGWAEYNEMLRSAIEKATNKSWTEIKELL